MNEKIGFVSIAQFRTFEGTLNIPRLAETILWEVRIPGTDLKSFLINTVLCNHGEILVPEMCALAREIFTGAKSDEILGSLSRDKCLGYSRDEVANIRSVLISPDVAQCGSTVLQEALGYKVIKDPFRRH